MSGQVNLQELAIDRGGTGFRPPGGGAWLTRYLLPLALLLVCAGVFGWSARDYFFPPREVQVTPVLVTKTQAVSAGTRLFQASGWIEPRPTPIRVSALAEGVVEKLLVVDDEEVAAGQPIAELVKDDARLALAAAQADLKLRAAELENARAANTAAQTRFQQPVHLEAPLRQADAELAKISTELTNLPFALRRAEAEQEFAQANYDGKLAAKDAIVGRTIDKALADLETARATVEELNRRQASLEAEQQALTQRRDALRKQLELLADEIQARDQSAAQVSAAAARVEQAQVAVDEAQLRMDRMTVHAPVAGRVYRLIGPPGSRIGGSLQMSDFDTSTVVTMYRPDMLQVRVDVRFVDVPKVSLGQDVLIHNASIAEPIVGRVLYISSEADIQKNTLQIKVALDAPPHFKPEMLVDATFLAPEVSGPAPTSEQERIYVPRELVLGSEGEPYVWLADQSEGRAYKLTVSLGDEANGLIEIKAGLNRTSRLISSEFAGLEDGMRIRVTGDSSAETPGGLLKSPESTAAARSTDTASLTSPENSHGGH